MKRIAPLSLVMFLAVVLVSGVAPVWAAQCGPASAPPKPCVNAATPWSTTIPFRRI